jgi:hypothetical protein
VASCHVADGTAIATAEVVADGDVDGDGGAFVVLETEARRSAAAVVPVYRRCIGQEQASAVYTTKQKWV